MASPFRGGFILLPDMMTKIPEGPFDAYIFDLDGTLADSMKIHLLAWQSALKKHHARFEFTAELFMSMAGVGHEDTVELLNERYNDRLNPLNVIADKEAFYAVHLPEIQPIPEVVEIAVKAHKDGMKIAVASGGPRVVVRATLEVLGILDIFPVVVSQTEVKNSKPDPEIFLLAARQLEVDPQKCLVFEDSPLGIEGAEKAGMKWVKIEPRLK